MERKNSTATAASSYISQETECVSVDMDNKKRVEINVVDWKNGVREVSLHFPDFDQMLTISPEGARYMAFRLMECADFIEPPFGGSISSNPEPLNLNPAEESFFGPYPEDETFENEGDDDEEESEEDEQC